MSNSDLNLGWGDEPGFGGFVFHSPFLPPAFQAFSPINLAVPPRSMLPLRSDEQHWMEWGSERVQWDLPNPGGESVALVSLYLGLGRGAHEPSPLPATPKPEVLPRDQV